MAEILSPWQDLTTLKERVDRLIKLTGHHRRVFESTNLRPECNLDCLNCRMHDNLRELLTVTVDAIAVLRAYRGRIHRAEENMDGDPSDYHTAYGIHRLLMAAADGLHRKAKGFGLLEAEQREYGV